MVGETEPAPGNSEAIDSTCLVVSHISGRRRVIRGKDCGEEERVLTQRGQIELLKCCYLDYNLGMKIHPKHQKDPDLKIGERRQRLMVQRQKCGGARHPSTSGPSTVANGSSWPFPAYLATNGYTG